MRRLGVLIVLLGVMVVVNALKTTPSGVGDPLTLAAIGFVVLAAFTVAEVGSALGLPRVTGYIVAGAVLGPSVANILSPAVVGEMRMFNTLALGLIATAAGLELDARQIARLWRTLSGTIAVKVGLGVLVVGGTLFAVEQLTGALGLAEQNRRIALALVFGTLSIGTSPAIALAVSNELRARGRLTDLVLGAAVLKDVVVVTALAIALTASRNLVGGGEGAEGQVLRALAEELGSSLVAGALLGALLIAYLRYVRAEMLLVVAGMILVTAEVARAFHLELLLVFITAGFVVRNLSRFEHDLMSPVEQVALPVFVVFFTIAGASIDLRATASILPIAIGLALARGVVYLVASHAGGALGGESVTMRRIAWLGYLPQAGVTLGLVGVAAHELPELAAPIQSLGMAVVAVNLLVGPVALRWALKAAGEAAEPSGAAAAPAPAAHPVGEARDSDLASLLATIGDDAARATVARIAKEVERAQEELLTALVEPWVAGAQEDVARVTRGSEDAVGDELAWLGARPWDGPLAVRAEGISQLYRRVRERLRQLPKTFELGFDDLAARQRDARSSGARWRWWLFRWRRRLSTKKTRPVPLAMMARVAFEPEIAAQCEQLLAQWGRAELRVLGELERFALGQCSAEQVVATVGEALGRFRSQVRAELRRGELRATRNLAVALGAAGTPDAESSAQAYSRVEPLVRARLAAVAESAARWASVLQATSQTVAVVGRVAELRRRTDAVLEQQVIVPMVTALVALRDVLGSVQERLRFDPESTPTGAELARRAEAAFPDDVWADLEEHTARFRTEVATHALTLEVRRTIGALPATLEALDPLAIADATDPTTMRPNEVEVLSQAERLLLGEMVPTIDEEVRAIASNVVAVSNRAHEAHQVVSYALARDDEDRERRDEVAREAVERALVLIEQQCTLLDDHARNVPSRARELAAARLSELDRMVLEPGRAVPIGSAVAPLLSRARRVVGRAYSATRRRYAQAAERIAQVLSGSLSRELYQRYYKQRFDAIEVNDFVARWRVAETIPPDYAELFSEEPLVGPRFFVEHQDALHALVSAERAWLDGGPASALVVGAHGSGRTSLVNQCKLKLGTPRLLRPQPLQWRRDIGIFQALGLALGARHGAGALTRALTATRTAVLLDDLENWFVPDPSGLADLERFLDLVVRTRRDVFWIATIEQETLALLEEAVPVTNAFGRIVRLAPSRAEALARVIEGRHVLSGRPLVFKAGPLSAVLERVPALRERDVFFRVLARASGGNLARALALWIRSVELDADGGVWPRLHLALTVSLPFVGRLAPEDQALLLLVLRFGPLRARVLAGVLALSRSETARRIAFLESAGLLEQTESDGPVQIPVTVRPLVLQGLGLMGVAP